MFKLRPQILGHTVLLSLYLLTCNAGPSYYITAPQYIVPGVNTTLAVHWFGQYSEVNVNASIISNGSNILVQADKLFRNDSIGLLIIPAMPENNTLKDYVLDVKGNVNDTLLFHQIMEISIQTKTMSMFIQTDKDIYRPGETVQIRVISVYQNLKPYHGDVDLEIKDPNSNTVKQWLSMTSNLGVVSTSFSLTNNPILGYWTIQAKSNSAIFSISFFVKDFDLPKCIVTLDAPLFYVAPNKPNLTGTVTARYDSNIPLEGNATITVHFGEESVSETYKISGSINFSFPYTKIQKAIDMSQMEVTASVTDQVTGVVTKTSSIILVRHSEYEIILIEQRPGFGIGGNFTFKIQIQRLDKKSLTEQERKENVSISMQSDTMSFPKIYSIPESGIITVQLPANTSSSPVVAVFVEYRKNTTYGFSAEMFTNVPIFQLQTPDTVLKVGIPFEIRVDAGVQQIFYTVVSRGLVVAAGKNGTTFTLVPENTWAPTAELLVYSFSSEYGFNSIIQLEKTLNIEGTLNNKLNLSWSKNRANPSEKVFLTANVIDSTSLVGLCITDKSSSLIPRENDLTASRVYQELNTYSKGPPRRLTSVDVYRPFTHTPYDMRGQDASVFTSVLTWNVIKMSSGLQANISVDVPNMNATWVATGFVISENLGLGVTEVPAEILTFKPFVVSLNMPYSVIRGEEFILEVILRHSLKEKLQVLVTLEQNTDFNIIVPYNNNSNSKPMVAGQQSVIVPIEQGASVLFPIQPKKLGNITFTVQVTSTASSDVISQSVLVKAEGVNYVYAQTEMFNLENISNAVSKNFSFSLPSDAVVGSEEAHVTVVGDLLVPSIKGLESLIQMPYGCGEQNMINLAPNIYILQYLNASKKITEDIRTTSIDYMNKGYQKELTYKRDDGSFSAFGTADISGSTWLSAFVFRCFLQAREYIYISSSVLDNIAQWLVQYQDMNTGAFSEPGRVIHKNLQGGLDGPVTLTAYILTSLLEETKYRLNYDANIQKAVQYIEKKFDEGISSNYTLSVVAYALTLAKSSKADSALNMLNSLAVVAGDLKFWSSASTATTTKTTDIETAAYALLSFTEHKRFSDAYPVMKWLSQQRNSFGGFESTQDTVMGLQALCKFSTVFPSVNNSLNVSIFGSTVNIPIQFQINNKNLLLLQRQQIEVSRPLTVNITAVGRGLAVVQFNVVYNRKTSSRRKRSTPGTEAFTLSVTVEEDKKNIYSLSVNICTSYQGPGNESGMVLIEIGLLSGFILKTEDFTRPQSLKLVEPQGDKVYLYLDSVTRDILCLSVPMVRFAKVAGSQDAVIKVYDYYNPEMSAMRAYHSLAMSQISSCDYCGSDCSLCRSNVPVTLKPITSDHPSSMKPPASDAYRPTMFMFWLCVVILCYFA